MRIPEGTQDAVLALLLECSNHHDPHVQMPHGLETAVAVAEMVDLSSGREAYAALRFMTLHSFQLQKRTWNSKSLLSRAEKFKDVSVESLIEALFSNEIERAVVTACSIALSKGQEAVEEALARAVVDDFGRLGHNLSSTSAYLEAMRRLPFPEKLVPIANAVAFLCWSLKGEARPSVGPLPSELHVEGSFEDCLATGDFVGIEACINQLIREANFPALYRPLTIASSINPGFLGHALMFCNSARKLTPILPAEFAFHLIWKLYRTTSSSFMYPEVFRLGGPKTIEPEAPLNALKASLQFRTPPIEQTLRLALEAGTPLDDIIRLAVSNYGSWTSGEKEHTLIYLNASLQAARFLGRDECMLPLVQGLSKLPF